MISKLNINHRARGGSANFVSDTFYNGRMEGFQKYHSDPIIVYNRGFLQTLPGPRAGCSSLFLNVKGDDNERADGTSYINYSNATCVKTLLPLILKAGIAHEEGYRASISILLPYRGRVALHKQNIVELSPAEIVHDLAQVRTVSGEKGFECDVVIANLVKFTLQALSAIITSEQSWVSELRNSQPGPATPKRGWTNDTAELHRGLQLLSIGTELDSPSLASRRMHGQIHATRASSHTVRTRVDVPRSSSPPAKNHITLATARQPLPSSLLETSLRNVR
ncbi:hypothetical protein F5B18DRAFT_639303 [Nemania serpens]|nr:hypothetical protein F5B18DRAFT_639303 [Nemania serpens]